MQKEKYLVIAVPRRISRRFHSDGCAKPTQGAAVPRRISRRFHSLDPWHEFQTPSCSTSYFKTFPQRKLVPESFEYWLFHVVFQDVSTARWSDRFWKNRAVPRRISRRFHSMRKYMECVWSSCSTSYFKTFPQRKGQKDRMGESCSTSYFKTFPQRRPPSPLR